MQELTLKASIPPFSHGRWYQHVLHAWDMLLLGGRLVAIIPFGSVREKYAEQWNTIYREGFVNEITVPKGEFKESGTMIETRILVLEKAV